jgi:triosephosphate isomerase
MFERPLLIANWKMAVSASTAEQLINVTHRYRQDPVDLVLCPSAPSIPAVHHRKLAVGAQTCAFQEEPKMTGELAPSFLAELGVQYVLAGHSERRLIFGETSERIHSQCQGILNHGMIPVLCVGETRQQRDQGKTDDVLESQLREALRGLQGIQKMLVAYEPVWAIGGVGAMEAQEAGAMIGRIRQIIQTLLPEEKGAVGVIYGGSVDAKNFPSLIDVGIQGFLVGTASQTPKEWEALIRVAITRPLVSS